MPVTLLRSLVCVAVGLAGLTLAHAPMLLSGLGRVQTDAGDTQSADTRFNIYVLEHSFRWISGQPGHAELWNPPFFYPSENALARSDVLVSVAPPYWGFRVLGAPPDSAFQLWVLTWSILNFLGAFVVFRRGFALSALGASSGAFLLAFGAPRLNQVGHPQLLPFGFSLLTAWSLARLGSTSEASAARRLALWTGVVFGVVGQLYAAFYLGWFLALALTVALLWGLSLRVYRAALVPLLKRDAWAIAIAMVAGACAIIPLAIHYAAMAREGNLPDPQFAALMVPTARSWINLGADSWLWGWTHQMAFFRDIPMPQEHRLGIGLVTTLACLAGLCLRWNHLPTRLAGLVGLGLMLCTSRFPSPLVPGIALFLAWTLAARNEHGAGGVRLPLALGGALGLFVCGVAAPQQPAAGAALFALFACIVGIFQEDPRSRRGSILTVLGLGLGARLCFLGIAPLTLAIAVPVLLASAIAVRRPAYRDPIRVVVPAALAAWLVVEGTADHRMLWPWLDAYFPGAVAIRAVSRVGLVVLLPASLGFASMIDTLGQRKQLAAVILLAVCVIEQGVRTKSYDKHEVRRQITALSAQTNPRSTAFYYAGNIGGLDLSKLSMLERYALSANIQVDAMWVQLQVNIPTINGYSGSTPRGYKLFRAFVGTNLPVAQVRARLNEWVAAHELPPERVSLMVGPARSTPRTAFWPE